MPKADSRASLPSGPDVGEIDRIRNISKILESTYGPKAWSRGDDPLSQLIKTILSQNTSDTNSLRAFQNLRERFPTWPQVNRAGIREVADAIRSGGLAQIKARRIKAILTQICREHPDCDLSFLGEWPTERIKDFLGRFAGVGEKTIACVLLFALNRPVLPVDTHILRVSKRLGLIPPQATADKAHRLLQSAVPQDLVYPFHLNLIEHGRAVCAARNPACEGCPLHRLCSFPIHLSVRSR
jgi:endonuclease-3